MYDQAFLDEMKSALLAEQERLQNERTELHPHTEMGNDDEDTMDELQVDEVNQSVLAKIDADLQKIEKALVKIADGTYGTADDGQHISEERLRALPWADTAL